MRCTVGIHPHIVPPALTHVLYRQHPYMRCTSLLLRCGLLASTHVLYRQHPSTCCTSRLRGGPHMYASKFALAGSHGTGRQTPQWRENTSVEGKLRAASFEVRQCLPGQTLVACPNVRPLSGCRCVICSWNRPMHRSSDGVQSCMCLSPVATR